MSDTRSDHRTPEEIELEIARERGALARTMEDLQERLSLDKVIGPLADNLKTVGNDLGTSVVDLVRRNPVPSALIGVGIAWMLANAASGRDHSGRGDQGHAGPDRDGDRYGRNRDAGAMPRTTGYGGAPYRPAGAATGATGIGGTGLPPYDRPGDTGYRTAASASGGARQTHAGHGHDDDDDHDSFMHSLREQIAEWGSLARSGTDALIERLSAGTHSMSREARERVISARERAMAAQVRAESALEHAADAVRDTATSHPYVVGAAAMAAGAAVGAMLPHTEREDRTLGAWRNAMFEEAERIFRQERDKLGAVASATVDEARSILKEAVGGPAEGEPDTDATLGEAAKSGTRSSVERLKAAAAEEAKNQGLGRAN